MHTCPECGSACHCGGDIDDIDVGDEEAENGCTCCAEGAVDEDFDNDYDSVKYEESLAEAEAEVRQNERDLTGPTTSEKPEPYGVREKE